MGRSLGVGPSPGVRPGRRITRTLVVLVLVGFFAAPAAVVGTSVGLPGPLAGSLGALALSAQPRPGVSTSGASEADGRWWSVGLGAGATRFTCDICARDRESGALLRVAYGGTARPGLRVGISGGGWTRVDDDTRAVLYQAGLLSYVEPSPGGRFHLIGGLGWSGYRSGGFGYDAAALTLGAGIDFPVSGSWVLSNDLLLDAASFGSLRNDGAVAARDVGLSVVRLEVVLTRR